MRLIGLRGRYLDLVIERKELMHPGVQMVHREREFGNQAAFAVKSKAIAFFGGSS